MEKIVLTAACFTLCMAGAYAQTAGQHVKQFPRIEMLNLKYLGNDSSSVLERIKKSDVTSRFLQKHKEANVHPKKTEKLKSDMLVMQPDSSVKSPILVAVPDSTILFHMRVKKQ